MDKQDRELINQLLEKIEKLEKEMAELKNRPENHIHYHYENMPVINPIPYQQPYIGDPPASPYTVTWASPGANCRSINTLCRN